MSSPNVPPVQRAIVLQGGGALGAYDAGVLKALCERIHEIDGEAASRKRNVFDVLAGTSSGAINASIVSGFVTDEIRKAKREGNEPNFREIWLDAVDRLQQFWIHISTESEVEKDPTFIERWNTYGRFNSSAASPEAARRWYSTGQFLQYGAKNVFTSPVLSPDYKYFDSFNTWYRYDNSPLRNALKKYGRFPIASIYEDGHPRLLIVSVDVKEGTAVTFDSYEKSSGSRFSKYKGVDSTHTIQYDSGIAEDHVMASASVPVNYDYAKLQDTANTTCYFWDGGWLSNTPLRELIGEHQSFWIESIGKNALGSDMWKDTNQKPKKVPDLRVYITNVWPRIVTEIPLDYDRVVERSRDLFFLDKTEYDQKVAMFVDDYINLIKEMRKLGRQNAADKDAFDLALSQLMDREATSSENSQGKRKNVDLIKGKMDVRVHRIQLEDDSDSTSRKFFDFSSGTIKKLMNNGYHDGRNKFNDIISNVNA